MQKNNEKYEAFEKIPTLEARKLLFNPDFPVYDISFVYRFVWYGLQYLLVFFDTSTDCDLLKSQGRDNESIDFPVRPLGNFCQFSVCG